MELSKTLPHRLVWRLIPKNPQDVEKGKDQEYLEEVKIYPTDTMDHPPDDPRGNWYSYVEYLDQPWKGNHDAQNSEARGRDRNRRYS